MPGPQTGPDAVGQPQQTGAQCLASQTDLYEVIGQIRATLVTLQDQVKIIQTPPATKAAH